MEVPAWLGLLSQRTRLIGIDTALSDGTLLVERMHGREAVNEGFRFEVDCLAASAFIDLEPLLGSVATLRLATADGGTRCWHGHVTQAAPMGADGGLARYRLTLEPWLAFLALRRNALIFQDKNALDVIAQVFADHPEAAWRHEVGATLRTRPICTQYRETDLAFVQRLLGEEGLSYRFEHRQGEGNDGDQAPGGHTLVIFDARAAAPAGEPSTVRFHRIDATEQDDAVSMFSERRQVASDRATAASWKASELLGVAGSAQAPADDDAPALPGLDVFEADRAGFFDAPDQARRRAETVLDARRLSAHTYGGSGAVRTLDAGRQYTLQGHPDLDGVAFVTLAVEHAAANNLGTGLAHLLTRTDIEAGSYRNRFEAVPAATPLAPLHRDRPTAPGLQSAIVVGTPGGALTSTRDHQVRVQFW
ncbi:type VI secretion system Vgr family protein, partial [Frateuria sp. Soil773]|uniref:type VI secretion system Vgr family protein n=1 Tax=Frateuria sp. Soil773 TaxID=1736407 RepID=UPI00138ED7BC